MKNIILIGSGNVATHLGLSLLNQGYTIKQVWSKQLINAKVLAKKVNSTATNELKNIEDADLYIISVKDNALVSIIQKLNVNNIVHTSGSIGLEIFNSKVKNYGVFYPLQTFNKEIHLDLITTPICIEANNKSFQKNLMRIGKDVSKKVIKMNSEQRKKIHLAAVFACNFTNHMFTIADEILSKNNTDFKLLIPIINQTVNKLNLHKPAKIQTGPAKRKETKIINSHINQLSDKKIKELYKLISESIIKYNV